MGRMLSYDELSSLKGIRFSRMHLLRLEKAKKFPRRVKVGERAIAWDEDEIDAHLDTKRAARDAPPLVPEGHRRVRRRAATV